MTSIRDQIIKILQKNNGLQQHEIVEKCGRNNKTRGSVCSALWCMKADGRVVHKNGKYYAAGGLQ